MPEDEKYVNKKYEMWYVCAVEIRLEDMGYGYDIPGMRYKRGDREYKKLDAG